LFVAGKIKNYRTILQRFIRDNGSNGEVESAIKSMEVSKSLALNTKEVAGLIGVEGDAANTYFGVFQNLMLQRKEEFPFYGRNKRPPKDAVNALLSFAYTLLANETAAALETVGLDPYVGFMHALRPGRTSLALDLMEEMRAYLGDRLVLSLINRKQVAPNDFVTQGESGVVMTDDCRKTVLTAWQNRKKETIVHPYLEEKIPVGLLPYVQALLLARAIRGDIDDYPVFLIH
jgi:CRISPR-associated protein Cas1